MSDTISLAAVVEKQPEALKAFEERLAEDGWAFVTLNEDFSERLLKAAVLLERFFVSTSRIEKLTYSENVLGEKELDGAVYGYNLVEPRKEGLRLLTGSRLKNSWLPPACKGLQELVDELDQLLLDLCVAVCPSLFNHTSEEIGRDWSIPLLLPEGHPKAKRDGRFAMMDVAYYFNTETENLINCAEHTDPGLFSLSVLSTQPGLQLKRQSGEWVDGPVQLHQLRAVVWGGKLIETISQGRLKAGIHRVTDPKVGSLPRMSIWTECITANQDLSKSAPLLKKIFKVPPLSTKTSKTNKSKNRNQSSSKKTGSLKGLSLYNRKMQSMTDVEVQPGQSVLDALSISSRRIGVPMSKSIRYTPPEIDHGVLSPRGTAARAPMTEIKVLPGESVRDAIYRCSQKFGVPMTKLITNYCPLCLDTIPEYGNELEEHVNKAHPNCIVDS